MMKLAPEQRYAVREPEDSTPSFRTTLNGLLWVSKTIVSCTEHGSSPVCCRKWPWLACSLLLLKSPAAQRLSCWQ